MSNLNKKVIIGLAVFFMLALFGNLFYSIYAKMIDKSSYTDWISAFCNVVMAGATVAAVLTARNYLAQFTAQEGFKIAIALVNDKMLSLVKHVNVINDYSCLHDKIFDFEGKVIEKAMITEITDLRVMLVRSYYPLKNLYQNIVEDKRKLDTYGIDVHENKREHYNSMMDNLSTFLRECDDLIEKSTTIAKTSTYLYDNDLGRYEKNVFSVKREKFKEPIPAKEQVREHWLAVMYNFTSLRKHGSSVNKIFKAYG